MPLPIVDAPMCREGLFTDGVEVHSALITAEKASFWDDVTPSCPEAGESCRRKAYLVRGDAVLTTVPRGAWTCAWYPGAKAPTVGWVRTADLLAAPDVVGTWIYHDTEVTVAIGATGITVKGLALWHGLGDNVHLGEIDGPLSWDGRALRYDDGACVVTFTPVGRWLSAHDNANCGGMNVRFDGIYQRRP